MMIIDNNWKEFVHEKNIKLSNEKTYVRVTSTKKRNNKNSCVLHFYIGKHIADYLGWDSDSFVKLMINPSYQLLIHPHVVGSRVGFNKNANVVSFSKTVRDNNFKLINCPTTEVENQILNNKDLVIDVSKLKA